MRINDFVTPVDGLIIESRLFLEQIIDEIRHSSPPPVSLVPGDKMDRDLARFFEEYYVPLDSRGHVPPDCTIEGTTLSSYEQRIIDFCRNPRAETRICVLHGHTGVGKSSLLRRVVYYVYPSSPSLKSSFFPIYMRMTPNLVDEDPDAVYMTIVDAICESTYGLLRNELQKDPHHLLRELNLRSHLYGQFSEHEIEQAAKCEVEDWLKATFKDAQTRREFLFNLLMLLIRVGKVRVVFIVDDVDRYSREMHTCIFLALDSLASVGIASIVSMRTSTFENTSAQLLEYHDQRIELRLNPELIQQILGRRVNRLRDSVHLYPQIAFRIRDYEEVSVSDVIACFCDLISRPSCMKALISLSNTNLTSVFLKLDLMSKSEAFSDKFIVHQLLERDVGEAGHPSSGKIWVFYHLLLGNYAGTYRRDPEARKAGLINAFDSSEPSNSPWRHFIRVNLLLYLYKMWRLTRDEEEYVRVAELQEKFKRTFGPAVGMSLFLDAIWALIESELVFMGSCLRYNKNLVTQQVFSDSVRISTAGRFYLENLMHKVEYLYFVKDDIDWRVDSLPKYLTPASRDYNRPAKFSSVLQSLGLLMKEEYNCLATLKAYWSGTEEMEDALGRYRDHFSPYGLPEGNAISICEVILENYKRFMKGRLGASSPGSVVETLINQLEELKDENEGLTKAYLQA